MLHICKAEMAKVEKLKRNFKKPNGLNLWKRVVKARRMYQGYVIKWFQ